MAKRLRKVMMRKQVERQRREERKRERYWQRWLSSDACAQIKADYLVSYSALASLPPHNGIPLVAHIHGVDVCYIGEDTDGKEHPAIFSPSSFEKEYQGVFI